MKLLNKDKPKVLFVSTVSSTLWVFYRHMIGALIAQGYNVTIAAADDYNLERFGTDYGCSIIKMKFSRRISPLGDLLCLIHLFRLMRKERYSLIHTHTPKASLLALAGSYFARVPQRVYTIHGLPLETAGGLQRKLLWMAEKLACKFATSVLIVSPSLKKRIIEENLCNPYKITVLANGSACGVDVNHFCRTEATEEEGRKIRERLGIAESDIVIGFVGRITPEKGIPALIRSFLNISKYKQISLLLVGEYDRSRKELSREVSDAISQNSRIFTAGFQDDPVPFFAAMDIFVMPTQREGFGMTFLEANAMDIPVIGCKVTGCVDAVIHNETGLLVSADNEKELTEAIVSLIDNVSLRKRLGYAGRKRTVNNFDSNILIQKHLELYGKLLEAH